MSDVQFVVLVILLVVGIAVGMMVRSQVSNVNTFVDSARSLGVRVQGDRYFPALRDSVTDLERRVIRMEIERDRPTPHRTCIERREDV